MGHCRGVCAPTSGRVVLVLAGLLSTGAMASADAINPNDILVGESDPGRAGGSIYEYTRSGALVQVFNVPQATGGDGPLRSIVVDGNGRIEAYNGTFHPYLTTVTPTAGPGNATFQNHTLAGWSTINNTQYTGIAYDNARNVVYATDQVTANDGGLNGVVRFDLNNNFAATRFAQGVQNGHGDYSSLTLGGNGLLYAIFPPTSPGENTVDVINPATGGILRTITLPVGYDRGIAVDAAGEIFTTGLSDGRIYRYDANGTLTGSLLTGSSALHGLALSNDGTLTTLGNNNTVYLTTTALASFTSFSAGDPNEFESFIAFGSPLQTVPEPTALTLAGLGLAIGRLRGRGRGGRAA